MERNFDNSIPRYYDSLNFKELWEQFPPAPDYFHAIYRMSRDELRVQQETKFLWQVRRGWEIPFYRRHWSAQGLEPGDIRGLEDLEKLPTFDVHDIRDSIERDPPWGDYIGIDPRHDAPIPLIVQTSGG